MYVALALANAKPVYFRFFGRDEVRIVDPVTGSVASISAAAFRARFVESWNCPPALKEKARAVMPYREWKRQRQRLDKGGKP